MSKRFEVLFYGDVINCVKDENGKEYNLQEIISILMNQQATITELEKEVNLLRPTNLEQYEQIQKLQEDINDYHNALFDLHKKYDKLEKENEQLKGEYNNMVEFDFGKVEGIIGFDKYIEEKLSEKQKVIDEQHKIIEQSKRYVSGLEFRIVKLEKENEQLKEQVKRLQDIGTRTEAEKEKYADLYCKYENELIKNGRRCDGVKDE